MSNRMHELNSSLLFNLHEVLVRDDDVIFCVESFLFLGIDMIFLSIVQPFTEREDISILGENRKFGMQCMGYVELNWIDVPESDLMPKSQSY